MELVNFISYDINIMLIRGGNMSKVINLEVYKGMLIVVDMVKGFTDEGALHDKEIKRIVLRQKEIIEEAQKKGYLIVFVKDTHDKNSTELKRFGNVGHCMRDTRETELTGQLQPYENMENTIIIEKNSTSFMEAPKFREIMKRAKNVKEINIVGCCSDICVFNGAMGLANYCDQWNRDVVIKVHEDAIATYNERNRQEYVAAAKLLGQQQGIQYVKKAA